MRTDRRGFLFAAAAAALAGCAAAGRPAKSGVRPRPSVTTSTAAGPTAPGPTAPGPTAPGPTTTGPTTTVPVPATRPDYFGLPVRAVAVEKAPIYYVDDFDRHLPKRSIALTVDDGPDLPYTEEILAILRHNRVHATFSVVGIEVQTHEKLLRRMLGDGHAICNHSLTHPEPFARLARSDIEHEVLGCHRAIYEATGHLPRVFRSPGGDWSPAVFETIARLGMRPIDWSVDPRDWSRPGVPFIETTLLATRPGQIMLCHDGGGDRSETVDALKVVLPKLKKRYLRFVTL